MTATYGAIGRTDYGVRVNTLAPVPAGTVDGDLLILVAVTGSATQVPVSLPAGFTAIGSAQSGADGSGFDWYAVMGYRIASSEPANYTCTHASSACETMMVRIDGVGTLSVDTFSQAVHVGDTGTSTATSVTPSAADDLLLFVSMNWDETALAPPTGMTEQQDAQFIYLATQPLTTSSATGTRTQTHTNSPWFANLIAIKDVVPAGTITFVGTNPNAVIDGASFNTALDTNMTGALVTGGGSGGVVQSGDLMIAMTGTFNRSAGVGAVTDSLGRTWNSVLNQVQNQTRWRLYWLIAGNETGNTITVAGSGNVADGGLLNIAVFRGVDPTTPLDVTTTTATSATGAANSPSITPTSNNCCIVAPYFMDLAAGDSSPGTVTNYTAALLCNVVADTNDAQIQQCYRLISGGAGVAQDPAAWSTLAGSSWLAATLALRPAAVGGGTTLTADGGNYTLTGTSAALAGKAILDAGAYTLTGFAATLGGSAQAAGGSYTLTGSAATFTTGYPSALTTGPAAGTSFTPFSGDFETSSDGEIVEALNVTGSIVIQHDNVTVRDCIVTCTGGLGISTSGSALTGGLIQRVRIIGAGNTIGISPDNMPACEISFCDISNVENGITVGDDDQYFHDNYIHDLDGVAVDPHIDGIQGTGGFSALTIEHNTIISWDTSCIILQNEGAAFSGAVIDDNLLIIDPALGGAYGILLQDKDSGGVGTVSNITVTNNHIRKGSSGGQVYAYFHNVIGLTWSGNVDALTLAPIDYDDGGGNTLPGDLSATAGSYTLTGTDAAFLTSGNVTLPASAGNYVLTGFPAMLAGKMTAEAGSYLLNGFSATVAGKALADAGSYTLTGSPVAFTFTRTGDFTLFCGSGSYALSGSDVSFPGYDPAPPVQPSTGSGYAGAWSGPKRRKRKRDEIEELIDAVIQPPVPVRTDRPTVLSPPPPALVDLMPKMQAVGLSPPQQKIVKRAIVSDDEDDDEEAIELLLNLLS